MKKADHSGALYKFVLTSAIGLSEPRRRLPRPSQMLRFDQTSCGVTRKILTANRGTDAIGQQSHIILALCRALRGDGEGPGQIHSPSKCRAVSPPTQDRDR